MSIQFKADQVAKNRELADKIKSAVSSKDGIITETESHSVYHGNLPEGITKDTVESLSKYNSKFVNAAHVAIGELAAESFVANKELPAVTGKIGYFAKNDSLEFTVSREKTYNNKFAGEGQPATVTRHLVIDMTAAVHGNKGSGVKSLRAAMSEEFAGICKK